MSTQNRRMLFSAFGHAVAGDGEKRFSERSSRDVIRDRYFPNVTLLTHEGKKVRFYDDLIKDKIVVLNMMYAECEGVCPTIIANLLKVQKKLGDRVGRDIFIYSITLKPERDTPSVLKKYAAAHGVKPGWLFLTGSPTDIETLRRRLGFTDPDPERDRDTSNHIGNVRYGNERLQLWAACPGMAKADWIVESISWVEWPENEQPGREPRNRNGGAAGRSKGGKR